MNPLLHPFNTPHATYPFPSITPAHIEEAILEGIRREDIEIEQIANASGAPTFENTILALAHTGELLERATTLMYNLTSAETNDELDELAQRIAPTLSEHSNNIMLNAALFNRVNFVWKAGFGNLNDEEQMLLRRTYESFERSGALLNDAQKARFREITGELSKLGLQFSQNNLKETNAYELLITDEAELDGLPEMHRKAAAEAAEKKGRQGWLFTLHAPSYLPFMTFAKSRARREELYMAYATRSTRPGETCNFPVVERLVNLRREYAQLLGYDTYARYALKRRMAATPEAVYELLDRLVEKYKAPAEREVAEVEAKARDIEGSNFAMQPWDFAYYSNLLKKERYDFDPEALRPYFELSKVVEGVFGLAGKLYGISFNENNRIPVYHPEVAAYEVTDRDGAFLGVLYTDFHPRKGKQSGAWMTNYLEECLLPGVAPREIPTAANTRRPHVSITANFTPPTADTPALLTLSEVETLLHEFGHALHGLFAMTRFSALSGTNVFWDFVELPSQFMENYAVEKSFLETFARHYQTGELLPSSLIERIAGSRNFNAAYACMRQVSFGLLDMAYYTLTTPFTADVRAFEAQAWAKAQLLPRVSEACMTTQFGHIMSGGYAAGYYSYKWAEVLDADAFSLFKERGIFNAETAESFRRNVLSQGGTADPMQLYVAFRGRKPTIDALLERNGISTK